MSDNIPFEIQMKIIKKVLAVKSLIRFRSVSKQWKSFMDSSEFIEDDNIETFKVQKQELAPFGLSPLLKQYRRSSLVGACHGLLCWNGISKVYKKEMVVIWNPSIRTLFGIVVPIDRYALTGEDRIVYGFGVCPGTSDPTVIKAIHADYAHWHVEVFTLSLGVWNVIPSDLPDSLKKGLLSSVSVSKLRESLVVSGYIYVAGEGIHWVYG
nr:hypothetical protein [Tanacetum cinerariifolium]